MRWKGQRLQPDKVQGEWSFTMLYAEMLAAHWWNITPEKWEEADIDTKAKMLKTWNLENLRQALEQREANKPHGKLS